MTGVASASENRSFKASEGRLYAAALSGALTASLMIASPVLYLIFVAILAFRDRVRINALMQQRVVALNLAPLSCRKFRFAKSSPHAIALVRFRNMEHLVAAASGGTRHANSIHAAAECAAMASPIPSVKLPPTSGAKVG